MGRRFDSDGIESESPEMTELFFYALNHEGNWSSPKLHNHSSPRGTRANRHNTNTRKNTDEFLQVTSGTISTVEI